MKTQLNKKLIICFITVAACFAAAKAQTVNNAAQKYLRPFSFNLPNGHKGKSFHGMHDPVCKKIPPCLTAQTTLGGGNYDQGNKMIQTLDGGFVVCGQTFSNDGDFHPKTGNVGDGFGDGFIAKYNRARQLQWAKTFGGTGDDGFNDIAETYDGGYIVTGSTSSNDGDVSGNHGDYDVWVVKVSASGNIQWQKCYGGTGGDFADALVKTIYGGYAVAAGTTSNDGDVSGNHNTDGNFDAWFIQVGPAGNLLFQHCYGGSDFEGFFGIVPSNFGSFILEGGTSSNDGDVSGNHGNGDAWVVKINALGKIVWQKAVGGSGNEGIRANCIATTTDGNVVIDGLSNSVDGNINAQNDSIVSFATKLNSSTGNIIWSKSYAEPSLRAGYGIFATKDGGAVEVGAVAPSFDGVTFDVLISKYDKNGNEEWYKRLGGSDFDGAVNGYESFNGDLNILCESNSLDGDVKGVHPGNTDEWMIKLGRCGEKSGDELPVAVSQGILISNFKSTTISLSSFPNPFSGSTNISFSLPQSQKVSIQIFDVSGRLMKTIANMQMEAGSHQITWDATDEKGVAVAKGLFFLKFTAGSYSETKKLSVLR